MPATEESPEAPSFLHLPPEIRLQIYQLVLDDDRLLQRGRNYPMLMRKHRSLMPRLSQVNRQIHEESTPIFCYGVRYVVISFHETHMRWFERWFDTVDPYALSHIYGFDLDGLPHSCSCRGETYHSLFDFLFVDLGDDDPVVMSQPGPSFHCYWASEEQNAEIKRQVSKFVEDGWKLERTKEKVLELIDLVWAAHAVARLKVLGSYVEVNTT